MSKKEPVSTEALDIVGLEAELQRERVKLSNRALVIGLLSALAVIVVLVIVVVSIFPVYRVHGSSMEPTISADDTIVCIRGGNYKTGDIVALDIDGKILIKRLVAKGGDWVQTDERGTLFINGEALSEPYAAISDSGETFSTPPMQVPDDEWFILGDNRAISGDSRLTEIGTVSDKQIIGKVLFRIFPIGKMGKIG